MRLGVGYANRPSPVVDYFSSKNGGSGYKVHKSLGQCETVLLNLASVERAHWALLW